MKRFLYAQLLILISLLNMGFLFKKSEIKGIVCGDSEFFTTLKKDFLLKNIYRQSKEIQDLGIGIGFIWFFDPKTGQLYDYEKYSDSIKPFYETKSNNNKYICYTKNERSCTTIYWRRTVYDVSAGYARTDGRA